MKATDFRGWLEKISQLNRRQKEQAKHYLSAYSTETGHSVHGKLDSRSVATRGLFFTPDLRV